MSSALSSAATRRQLLHWALAQGLILPGALRAATQDEAQRPRLRVGPSQAYKSLASAARAARDGMLIEVEAGDYNADVAAWPQHDLILRAVGGRVRLNALGAHEQGKGLFVCSGERQLIEGFEFRGARVPDRNGAGIRQEAGSLRLRDCSFQDNENGLLAANNPKIQLDIEGCEFGPIVPGDGRTHNLYVGQIGRFSMRQYLAQRAHYAVVTHEMGFAREAANHMLFLHQGLVEDEGPPREVMANPKSERFRQFLSGSLK